jgi:MFS family permease
VTVTAVFAVYALVLLAALLVVGRLSDYFGRRPVLIAGLAISAAACVVWWLVPGTGALYAARAMQGAGVGLATGAIGAALLELEPARRRTRPVRALPDEAGLVAAARGVRGRPARRGAHA